MKSMYQNKIIKERLEFKRLMNLQFNDFISFLKLTCNNKIKKNKQENLLKNLLRDITKLFQLRTTDQMLLSYMLHNVTVVWEEKYFKLIKTYLIAQEDHYHLEI